MLAATGDLGSLFYAEPWLTRAGNVGTTLSRFALLAASATVLRRPLTSTGVVTAAVGFGE